jgi:Na+:H+ antiporter, NhaA family
MILNKKRSMKLTKLFSEFFNSEKAGGIVLIICTAISLLLANSALQSDYVAIWHVNMAGMSASHWINDGLMAIFFLLIGLELEREIYIGELSNIKNAALPLFSALGGMLVPALLYLLINFGKDTQSGFGIPMATDIAFAIGILSLLGNKVSPMLKVFLTALAVIDDLGAILLIAIFYTHSLSLLYLLIALGIFGLLLVLNRLKVHSLTIYIIGGIAMWYCMLHSGIHATITGVLLAFAIPFGDGSQQSPSWKLQHFLHKPVAFIILPLFALANTGIPVGGNWFSELSQPNSTGILTGLIIGKALGIFLFAFLAVRAGLCTLPGDLTWRNVAGAGFLGGIGFTMSIFITLLAFDDAGLINSSKIAVLTGSLIAAVIGFVWLKIVLKPSMALNKPA